MFIPTGPVGFRGSNGDGDGARFPPIVLSGPGRGSAIGAWGGDGERPPPRPAPLPSLGGIGGRDCEAQRERIKFDRGWGKVRPWGRVRPGRPIKIVSSRPPCQGGSLRPDWAIVPGRARTGTKNRAFGLQAFWTSIGLLGLAWVTDGWRSMLSRRWDEEARLWEDRMDRLGQKSCVCTLHFFNYPSLNFYYAICTVYFYCLISWLVLCIFKTYWLIVLSMHGRVCGWLLVWLCCC
jgi:hypothetical protein